MHTRTRAGCHTGVQGGLASSARSHCLAADHARADLVLAPACSPTVWVFTVSLQALLGRGVRCGSDGLVVCELGARCYEDRKYLLIYYLYALSLSIYISICLYISAFYVSKYANTSRYIHIYKHVNMYIYLYMCIYTYMHTHILLI